MRSPHTTMKPSSHSLKLEKTCTKQKRHNVAKNFFKEWCPHKLKVIHFNQTVNLFTLWKQKDQFTSVQLLSCVRLFATPWITARQASLSITNSWSLLKLLCIESVMPWSHLILSSPSPLDPSPFQHQGLFQWVNSSHEVAKVLEFQLQHQSFQWTPRTDLL